MAKQFNPSPRDFNASFAGDGDFFNTDALGTPLTVALWAASLLIIGGAVGRAIYSK